MRLEPRTEPGAVLIVEDDLDISEAIDIALQRAGYRTTKVDNGHDAVEACRREPPDVIVLDLMLPDMSGIDILKAVKQADGAPRTRVIILTAKTDEVDRILGFELGADDYVTKPFSPRELALRVRAVMQRGSQASGPASPTMLRMGPIEVDGELHQARVDGRVIDLTLTEFRLLSGLMRANGRVRTRESLLSEIWGYSVEVMSRTVDTHIRRLRSKLGSAAPWLVTVRGVGYRLQQPPEQS